MAGLTQPTDYMGEFMKGAAKKQISNLYDQYAKKEIDYSQLMEQSAHAMAPVDPTQAAQYAQIPEQMRQQQVANKAKMAEYAIEQGMANPNMTQEQLNSMVDAYKKDPELGKMFPDGFQLLKTNKGNKVAMQYGKLAPQHQQAIAKQLGTTPQATDLVSASYQNGQMGQDWELAPVSTTGTGSGKPLTEFQQQSISSSMSRALDPQAARQGMFGKNEELRQRSMRLDQTIKQVDEAGGNPKLINQQELISGMANIFIGGKPSVTQMKEMEIKSLPGTLSKISSWLQNEPNGTNQQKFWNYYVAQLRREEQKISKEVKKEQYRRVAQFNDFRAREPELWKANLMSFDITPEDYDAYVKSGYKQIPGIDESQGYMPEGTQKSNTNLPPPREGERFVDSKGIEHLYKNGTWNIVKKGGVSG